MPPACPAAQPRLYWIGLYSRSSNGLPKPGWIFSRNCFVCASPRCASYACRFSHTSTIVKWFVRSTSRSTSNRTGPASFRLSAANCSRALLVSAAKLGNTSMYVTTYNCFAAGCWAPAANAARASSTIICNQRLILLLPVETAFVNGFTQNVPFHRIHHVGAGSIRLQVQLGVQREQFDRVVVVRSIGLSARPHVRIRSARVL